MLLFPSYNYKSYFVQVPHDAGAQGQPPVRDQQRGLRDGVAPRARRHRVPGGQHGDQVDKTTVANYCQLLPTPIPGRARRSRRTTCTSWTWRSRGTQTSTTRHTAHTRTISSRE